MTDPYEARLAERVEALCPGAWEGLCDIQAFPEAAGEAVLRELLETGCLSQNAANIEGVRRAVRRLPGDWLAAHLPQVAPACLFQERAWQEWEFRRAGELLQGPFPEAFAWLVSYGRTLHNPEVDEAIGDFLD